jgi:membrane associated rhomboid family serine protease
VTQDRDTAQDYCYRHPNRQSFVLCQRCGRTICGECQTPAPVGFVCPECMREQRATAPRTRPAILTRMTGRNAPVVTYGIIALCVVVFIAQSLPGIGGTVTAALQYAGLYSYPQVFQPWRMFTTIFAHANFFHILLNMYTLWVFGMVMEPMLGRVRYLVVFLISGFAGSLGVLFLADPRLPVVGASGAIFGLMGALIIIQRKLGGPMMQLLILVGINLVIGFIPAFGIAWQAHVGGLVGGALAGVILTETRSRARRPLQIGLLVLLAVLLVVVSFWKFYA